MSTRTEYDKPERKRGARLMMGESAVGAFVSGIYGNFAGALAIKMGASTFQMGMFSASTQLLCTISQVSAARVVGFFGGRKRMIIAVILISALPWAFIAAVPFMPPSTRVWMLIPLSAITWSLYSITDPVWGSWMSDMVAASRRGRYLGIRSSMVTLISLAVGMTGAAILDRLQGVVLWGFAIMFAIAVFGRILSALVLSRVVDPQPELRPQTAVAPWRQLAHIGQSTLGRFNLFVIFFHFGINLSAPFFGVFLLRDLGISYITYVGLTVAYSIASIIATPFWGQVVDRKGSLFVLAFSSPFFFFVPMQYIISTAIWSLVLFRIMLGLTQSAWGIAAYNFVLRNSADESRTSAVGSYQAMANLGSFIGSVVGGLVAGFLPTIFAYQLFTIFIISAVMRLASVIFLLPRVVQKQDKEVRPRTRWASRLPHFSIPHNRKRGLEGERAEVDVTKTTLPPGV